MSASIPSDEPSATVEQGRNVEMAFTSIRSAILSGALPPGEVLPQARLAQELNISRTPMREALRMLFHEGLIELQARRRPVVSRLTAQDFEDLYIVRISLEWSAICLTIPQMGPEQVAHLEGLRAQAAHFAEAGDAERWEVPHREFQAALAAGAGKRSASILAELSDHSARYRRFIIARDPGTWDAFTSDHRELVALAMKGAGREAADARVGHLMRTARRVIPALDADYDFSRLVALHAHLTDQSEPDAAAR